MSVTKPVAVPKKEITSVDVVGWTSGLNLNGAQNAPPSSFIESKDVELSIDGFLMPRRTLLPFLPDTIETTYQKLPILWNNKIYYFTADANKIKFCQEGDAGWTNCGGANTIVTNNGGKPKFLRTLDKVLLLNGTNGDKLCYVDLSIAGFPVVKYSLVADPTTALTSALTVVTATPTFYIYYAYSYSGAAGETQLSSILSQPIGTVRDQWQTMKTSGASTPGSIRLTRPAGAAPAGATYWNLYVALASVGGTIASKDMLMLALKLDLATHDFVDDGTLAINLGSVAPSANSTDGPKVDHGIVEDGIPILFGDVAHSENIWIGGPGPYAMDFSVSNGGYQAQPEKGTNFSPTAVIGFRNGQGTPSLTVLFSNTEGLAKQSVLEQQTINYGNQSFSVWGVKEQHYGAAGVAATDSAINYNGKLVFLSTDGFMSMNTQPLRQNVISTDPISIGTIDKYIRAIKSSAMKEVIGAGWDNKFMWTVPSAGFDTAQQILIYDDNNKVADKSAWYALNIPAQWIGVVTPRNDSAFIYICQGKSSYKLANANGTFDVKSGLRVPFSTGATGPLVSMGTPGHNHWKAIVQAVFQVVGLVGDITVGVTYMDLNGKSKTKSKVYHGPVFTASATSGWGGTQWTYSGFPAIPGWGKSSMVTGGAAIGITAQDIRIPLQIDDLVNEAQWFISTPVGYGNYKLRSVVFEGVNLGVRPDLH